MPEVVEIVVQQAAVVIEIECPADLVAVQEPDGIVDRAGAYVRTRAAEYIRPR